ncbi:hypothetical protein AVEN_201587-1 [Araneus ventricosus]|uniref:Uncharacterized protein n=1 Tax=Araneus ventricosus TaxID=182803 RepID=A0A4Y2FGU9_ARAVE|nr:hypothetical protein AVEN_201587-1 [Araneus ventricosus]
MIRSGPNRGAFSNRCEITLHCFLIPLSRRIIEIPRPPRSLTNARAISHSRFPLGLHYRLQFPPPRCLSLSLAGHVLEKITTTDYAASQTGRNFGPTKHYQ